MIALEPAFHTEFLETAGRIASGPAIFGLRAVSWYVIFLAYSHSRKVSVGTTKLTRKEILAEDPVHQAIMELVEFFRENGKKVGIAAVVVVLLAIGIYGGMQYLDFRQTQEQEQLGKGMEFFHAQVSSDAADDPYAKGPTPIFRTETAKYQAAAKEFSSVLSGFGSTKLSVVARYYLGLTQLKLGQKKDAIKNLETVANNSRDRTVGYLARKVLATEYLASGNYLGAKGLLEGVIRDPQCDLPKEDLSLDLSKVLVAQGKRDEAIKVLRDATAQGAQFSLLKQRLVTELDKLQKGAKTGSQP
jgi:predicted negative regulator of RcsB-dependent stress response